ncbi:response regulator [Thermodesulfobacteriota bacterium]
MENVLIVDDDEGFLLSLEDLLKGSSRKFSVLTAHNGIQASRILDSSQVSLVVTDLKMPEMDGFTLLANISQAHPDIPVIVMTAYGTPEMENRLKDMGAFQYIEKPIDFNILFKKISDGLAACSRGHIDGISLPSFMQLLQLDKKTCTLTVTSNKRVGLLYFQKGELKNASTEDLEGLEAAMEISSWVKTRIEIINICKNSQKIIEVPLGFILIEGARLKDEREHAISQEQSVQTSPETRDTPLQPIKGINLDALDFDITPLEDGITEEHLFQEATRDTPPPSEEAPQEPITPPQAQPRHTPKNKDCLALLAEAIDSYEGIIQMIVIARDGKVLVKKNAEVKKFGNFVAYVAGASEQAGVDMKFSKPSDIIVNQVSGEKIVVIPGPAITVGIEVEKKASPAAIANGLRPLIMQATT